MVSLQYLVVESALGIPPVEVGSMDGLDEAINKFEQIAKKTLDASVIVYDSDSDSICKVLMKSEPILLVKAIEYARLSTGNVTWNDETENTELIDTIVEYLKKPASVSEPESDISPYIIVSGDGAGTAGVTAGIYGGISGVVIGMFSWGPAGAVIGGVIGTLVLGYCSMNIFNKIVVKNLCKKCNRSGLQGNNYRCKICDGYGYTKKIF